MFYQIIPLTVDKTQSRKNVPFNESYFDLLSKLRL